MSRISFTHKKDFENERFKSVRVKNKKIKIILVKNFVEDMLTGTTSKISKGIRINFLGKNYDLKYPNGFWKTYPDAMKQFFFDNLTFTTTAHLPTLLNHNGLTLNTSLPLFKPWIEQMLIGSIPFDADQEGKSTTQMMVDFLKLEFNFKDIQVKLPQYDANLGDRAVINFTFGKESLLTYGLSREIGLDCDLIYFKSPAAPLENKLKTKYAEKFMKLMNQEVIMVENGPEALCDNETFGLPDTEWGYGNQLTMYALEMLPVASARGSKFIMFGNEKSCSNYYLNGEGFKAYPVFDQSVKWMIELNNMIKICTNKQGSIVSFVEPINELGVMKILHNRYKDLRGFQFSCFPDNKFNINKEPWCHACTKCARIFVFLKALGIDVEDVGFHQNLFDKGHEHIFPLFADGKIKTDVSYDASGLGKDEQLFAFYLATRRGESGYVVDLFKEKFLNEAKAREDELHKEFLGVFDSKTIPQEMKPKVMSIFKEELNGSII